MRNLPFAVPFVLAACLLSPAARGGGSVAFTQPLPLSNVVHDVQAFMGSWKLTRVFNGLERNDTDITFLVAAGSNDCLVSRSITSKGGVPESHDNPPFRLYRIGQQLYLSTPRLRMTTDPETNTLSLYALDYSAVTNDIAEGRLEGSIRPFDHLDSMAVITSATERLVEYLVSGQARFDVHPLAVLERRADRKDGGSEHE